MKRYLLFAICALSFGLLAHADNLSEGELGFKYDSITPNMIGQATNDHLFVEKGVSFFSGDTQLVWFYLDDDEIYQNSTVQALTPMPYNANGARYNEITYNSFQCDIYLPEGISITTVEDEDGDEISYMGGDRLPRTAFINWASRGTKVIDDKTYNVFSIVCYNASAYGTHFSSRTAKLYEQNGALKKEHTLFALYLRNDNQSEAVSRMSQDLIIANQIFNIYESVDANWDANQSTFFYGTGGNNETQVFMKYDRTGMYGSSGYDRNYFFLPENTDMLHGKTVNLPITMQNEDDVSGFQTELKLPEGFTIPMEGETYQVELSERKVSDHTLEVQKMENGIYKITSQSPSHTAYSGTAGTLLYVTLQAPANVDSTYTLYLNNTVLTGTDGKPIYVNDDTGTVTVYPYNLGDVNNNSYYTVGDVVTTTSYTLGNNPSPFISMAADMNGDYALDMTDIDMMANVVLEDETALPDNFGNQTDDLLHIDDFMMAPGGSMTVNVMLDNQQEYTAFQTDIILTEGLSIRKAGQDDAFTPSEMRLPTEHNFYSYLHEDNSIRVISYSHQNAPILENQGTLFSFDVVAAENFTGPGTITLSRTLFSTAEGTEYRLADAECNVMKALRGDVNGDGLVNVSDINVVVNIILGGKASPEVIKRADVNGDGMITISDINLLISIILS